MKGITWSRDSHGLFDYESRHLTKSTMKADKETQIIRIGNEIQLKDLLNHKIEAFSEESEAKPLLNIINIGGRIFPPNNVD